ncbi:SDR family NAD(P)-dependent oxidoreductase [Halobaculum halobium]|uniref:SDR family NAD(P)-dependent oxidoreductase n=1 Tax=Halobaculum halobium TaxID=3032281 RepID=A0ABD5T7B9_9EURY|nr:SDR family NAD(P)-dependent oxidoreductase [Halobaculum sp. SYNS20]
MDWTKRHRTVVITGANEGIGYHLLTSLVEDGYRVAGLDINGEHIEPLQNSHPELVRFIDCDVTVDEDVETAIGEVVSEWGPIDILVNNAGIFNFDLFEDQTLADTKREFEVNYFGYVRLIHAILPHMRERGEGLIHNVSSGAGLVGHPGLSGYASTKGAIEALVRSLRLELQHENVTCTVMHPPLSNTRSTAELGYPESLLSDPKTVGRKLLGRSNRGGRLSTPTGRRNSASPSRNAFRISSEREPSSSSNPPSKSSVLMEGTPHGEASSRTLIGVEQPLSTCARVNSSGEFRSGDIHRVDRGCGEISCHRLAGVSLSWRRR